MRHYTEREIRFIRNNYQNMTDNQLSSKMNRTPTGVKRFRQSIGLYKVDEDFYRTNFYTTIGLLKQEKKALEHYISIGKGGDIANERLAFLVGKMPKMKERSPRKDSTPLRVVAKAYSLFKTGMTHQQIADEMGYSRSYITKCVLRVNCVKDGITVTLPSKV